ncbi:glycosyltransferase [Halalkalibacterium halodurans]|uniref:glycosyltransferase n=1 Tax=Halalkalibacterium halodurans TaxID=86665 RepID=UPI002E1BC4C8|nr:glycosyltransferase [Halalkalibacterium halodurans]MED4083726.1 glycosyltransferase [Halalkalibacterium halodurans]MED4106585.1 glycosyltransferase [Halalkalibacterium halodurans]MED4109567.1 glycosyltransferase [Halalkalibacterium halodurans]MED4151171.1 glycosyltransferase [Halalkalibacterium halodurans]
MKKKYVLLVPNLNGGGAEKVILTLFKEIQKYDSNIEVYLITVNKVGSLVKQLPENSNLIDLGIDRIRRAPRPLIKVLNEIRPDTILSTLTGMNLLLLMIRPFLKGSPKIVVRETNPPSSKFRSTKIKLLYRIFYRFADKIIGISEGVSSDVTEYAAISKEKVVTIYNPIDIKDIRTKAQHYTGNDWLDKKDTLVILAIGRLVEQKDFTTLIKAFAKLRQTLDCKLVILGEGPEKDSLLQLTYELNVNKYVLFQGFVDNPYAYLEKSDLFVLSSKWEGFGLVIAEALATKTPIVSTNCMGAPAEILEYGRYGELVEPGDFLGMSEAMHNMIINPYKNEELLFKRANDFNVNHITKQYLQVLE